MFMTIDLMFNAIDFNLKSIDFNLNSIDFNLKTIDFNSTASKLNPIRIHLPGVNTERTGARPARRTSPRFHESALRVPPILRQCVR